MLCIFKKKHTRKTDSFVLSMSATTAMMADGQMMDRQIMVSFRLVNMFKMVEPAYMVMEKGVHGRYHRWMLKGLPGFQARVEQLVVPLGIPRLRTLTVEVAVSVRM